MRHIHATTSLASALMFTAAALLVSVAAAPALHAREQGLDADVYEKLDVFAHVLEKIRTSYVEPVTQTTVIENAINGMLTSLDPHSAYLNQDDFKDLQQQTQGEFGGLGIEVTMDNGLVKVVSPIDDTPAQRAGLQPEDLIIRLDGKDVQGMTLKDAVDRMRGKPGTTLRMVVFRESEKRTFSVTLTRAVITVKPVKSQLVQPGVGYLRITSFNDYAENTLVNHLESLTKDNQGPLQGLILDLRNNPGGLLTQAVAVADDFLTQGEIVSTRGRIAGQNSRFVARGGDILNGKPIVVLINGGSASAAEIVAGALQDQRRAVLLGTKSFGKGSVQTIFNLPGETGMRLTTALYYTPSGRSIQAEGIVPDIAVKPLPNPKAIDADVDENDLPSEASLQGHLEGGKEGGKKAPVVAAPRPELPKAIYAPAPVKTPSNTLLNIDKKPDAQLDRAVAVLTMLIASQPKAAAGPAGK